MLPLKGDREVGGAFDRHSSAVDALHGEMSIAPNVPEITRHDSLLHARLEPRPKDTEILP